MHRMHRIFSGNGWLAFLSIRKSEPDHRRSQLLVQQRPVLVILCILCIHVQFFGPSRLVCPVAGARCAQNSNAVFSFGVDHE